MEKIKSILSPGKHVEDEILYGSGGSGQYQHTGREAPGSTSGGGYYGGAAGTGGQNQVYNRERDSIPSQPSTAQEYGKTEDEYAQAEKERAAKAKIAKEQSTKESGALYNGEKTTKKEKHQRTKSGEHKESRNPYTQQTVDPRLGEGSEESRAAAARQAQTQAQTQGQSGAYAAGYAPTDTTTAAGYAPTDTTRTTQGYEDTTGHGGKGAAAAGLGVAGAGAAGAAGLAHQKKSETTGYQHVPGAYDTSGYEPTDAYGTADTTRTAQGYEPEVATSHGGKGAAAAGLGVAGAAGAAGVAHHAQSSNTDSPQGEIVGRTVSGHHTVERTASGQYRTRLASIIDPNYGQGGASPSENAYEHTPGGGGAYEADKFHSRESRVASVTTADGKKYTDPAADENYGLGYSSKLPAGVPYKAPAGSGAYERGSYGAQGQPQVATTKSEATRALSGDEGKKSHAGAYTAAGAAGAGLVGAGVADAGFEGTKTDKAHPHTEDPAYKTSRVHNADDPVYKSHPSTTEKHTSTTEKIKEAVTPHHKADKTDKSTTKKASQSAAAQRGDESAYAAPAQTKTAQQPTTAKYGDVDVPPGNDYGKGVKDPRYGLPMAAAGISASEAAALRRNEAGAPSGAARPSTADQAYATQPSTTNQAYANQPAVADQAYSTKQSAKPEQTVSKSTTKEEKPSRRSSILGFLHLGKDKDKKRQSKDEKRLSDPSRQPYTDRTGQAPLGSAAGAAGGYAGQQAPEAGSVAGGPGGHGEPGNSAYRDRMPSTADAPAFTGGLVAPNGAPLKGAEAGNADSSAWAKSTEREVMDKGYGDSGAGTQAAYGGAGAAGTGAAANQAAYGGAGTADRAAYGSTGTANQAAYGTGIDESYPNEGAATTGQKSGSHGAATTGGAIAAGAAAGGLAAHGMRGSQANEGVASDYNLQNAQDKGAPNDTGLYDQVSPRSSKAQETSHKTNHTTKETKETKTNHKSHGHKDKNSTAYAGSDAQARDAEYGGYRNDSQGGSSLQNDYGTPAQTGKSPAYDTYGNGAESNAAYGGKETQASNAAYGNEAYSGAGTQNPDEAAFGNEEYAPNAGQGSNGVSRHGTTKIAERAGHHVLHKDPPASHPAAAIGGGL